MSVDVLLVPVGLGRYALYSEPPDTRPDVAEAGRAGLWRRLVDQFRTFLATVEREHDARAGQSGGEVPAGLRARLKLRFFRWLAERVAEQRLLWHLRTVAEAALRHPDDLPPDQAHRTLQGILKHDADRHLVWLTVNGLLFVASGVLAPFPGPNLIAYYFAFRLVGHVLSWRGARHGMVAVAWARAPEAALSELRRVAGLPPPVRDAEVAAIAARLGTPRLPRFFLRTATAG